MKQHWDNLVGKFESLSLRERGMIFVAIAFLLVSLVNMLFLDPLIVKQKKLAEHRVQQQEKLKEVRALMEGLLQSQKSSADSPMHKQLGQAKQQLAEGDAYLKSLRDGLVAPEKMANLLQQVLKKDGQLELVSLQSLPVEPLIAVRRDGTKTTPEVDMGGQVYTHRVKITVRGSYQEILNYLTMLEHLPTRMFWGNAALKVVQQPTAELTLTLYTLSLDKTWLQI